MSDGTLSVGNNYNLVTIANKEPIQNQKNIDTTKIDTQKIVIETIKPKDTIKLDNNASISKVGTFNFVDEPPKNLTVKETTNKPKSEEPSAITKLATNLVHSPITNSYLACRDKAEYKPIIAELDKAIKEGKSVKDLEKIAVNTTHKLNGKLSPEKTLAMAYESILASTIHNKYSDPNFFNGEKDKILHYFVSGAMTLQSSASTFLPPQVTGAGVLFLGFLKEVASIPGNGYSSEDMDANTKGINNALANLEKFEKYGSL